MIASFARAAERTAGLHPGASSGDRHGAPALSLPRGASRYVQAKALVNLPKGSRLPEGNWPSGALPTRIVVAKPSEHIPLNRQAVVMAGHRVLIDRSGPAN